MRIDRRTALKQMLGAASLLALHPYGIASTGTTLNYKAIPSSGEKIPVVGLGTSRVFDIGSTAADRAAALEVVRALAAVNNSMVDSSPMYGRAEAVVGDLVKQLDVRKQLFFATKVWIEGREAGIAQMQESMQLMQTDKLDLIQIHNLLDWETHIKTLRNWKEEEKVRYIGITHYNEGGHAAVESLLKKEPLDFLQINYSLIEPEAADRILPLAADKGVAVIINRPFARGQLFRMTRGKMLPEWSREFGCETWAQFFLKFVVSHPAVTVAIPGTSKLKHMLDNQNGGRGTLPDEKTRRKMLSYMHSI